MNESSEAGKPRPAERVTYLYTLTDPRDGSVRYLGKTVNPARRYYMHLFNATHGRDTHKDRWIRTLVDDDVEPVMSVIEEVRGESWQEREVYWIDTLRTQGCDLTNVAEGGRGVIAARTAEWKRKTGEAHKGKGMSAELRSYFSTLYRERSDRHGCKYGHPWTPENTLSITTKTGRTYRRCKICQNVAQRASYRRTGKLKGRTKPHCKLGHALAGENLRILVRTRGEATYEERICRACVRLRNSESKRRARVRKEAS